MKSEKEQTKKFSNGLNYLWWSLYWFGMFLVLIGLITDQPDTSNSGFILVLFCKVDLLMDRVTKLEEKRD